MKLFSSQNLIVQDNKKSINIYKGKGDYPDSLQDNPFFQKMIKLNIIKLDNEPKPFIPAKQENKKKSDKKEIKESPIHSNPLLDNEEDDKDVSTV